MDKQTFYAELSDRLVRLDVGRDYIERHFKQFDGYFQGKSEEEIAHEIEKLGDLDRVAARIKRMTDKIRTEEAVAKETKEKSQIEKGMSVDRIPPAVDVESDSQAATEVTVEEEQDVFVKKASGKPIGQPPVSVAENDNSALASGKKRGSHDDSYLNRITEAVPDEETIRKNRTKFWVLFALTLPITAAILAATGAVFAFVFFIIAVLIIASVAALVAVTAAGTLISLFGLIFGAAQMLSAVPIGLYECGLAIMIGSAAMFVGILIYNFAVRLLPFAARWLLIFMRFVFKKYRQLFVFLKREVIGL